MFGKLFACLGLNLSPGLWFFPPFALHCK
jgi:hypothetical protein